MIIFRTQPMFTLFFLFTLLTSCAHNYKRGEREITNSLNDGLRFESLNRYGVKRIQENKTVLRPLSLCYQGEFSQAFKLMRTSLDKEVNNPLYWNQMGSCYILEEKITLAENALKTGLSLTKNRQDKALILNNLGVIQLKKENYKKARFLFQESIKYDKLFLTSKYNLSQVHLKFSHYNKAQKILDQLLQVAAQDIDFLNSYAHLKLMTKKYKEALTLFKKIPKIYHSRDDISTNLALTYFKLEKYKEAKKVLKDSQKTSSFYLTAQARITKSIEKVTKK